MSVPVENLITRLERERPEHPEQVKVMREHYKRVDRFYSVTRHEQRCEGCGFCKRV